MTEEERQRFAAEWREKYPFSLEELTDSSPAAIATFRAEEAVRECAEAFRDRVLRGLYEAMDSLSEPLRGAKDSVESRLEELRSARSSGPSGALSALLNDDEAGIEPYPEERRHTRYPRLCESSYMIELFEEELRRIHEFISDFNGQMNVLIGASEMNPPYPPASGAVGKTRTDLSFGRAIHDLVCVQLYNASPKKQVNWSDVRRALEWLGHDVSKLDRKDLREVYSRFRKAEPKYIPATG